ncbi:MAG: hypothetical protein SCALA701_19240 [Candidatus Scalindua sp.]|nr:MAG: hypothetical protein EX341_04575 [Candidatus Scalindua sp. SCAELEC01]GJQ59123.1 MAG: hypothetical protein SCALA701_19240 [Candidatus Scalindua sp.]
MEIEVVGNIIEEEKISVEFEKLSIKEALEKLSSNYGYQIDSEKEEKNNHGNIKHITKIIILPKGEETAPLRVTAKDSEIQEREGKETLRPEPFKFVFDPSESLEEE